MANVHGMGDYRNNRPNGGGGFGGGGGGGGAPGGGGAAGLYSVLGVNRDDPNKDPRSENFFDMLHYSFCPTLRFMSWTVMVSLINIALFIITLAIEGIYTPGEFLQVNSTGIISTFAQDSYQIRVNYQYYRLLTACFFHLSFSHIVMNTFSLLIWGSIIETFVGTPIYIIIYLFSGIAGNLMSAVVHMNEHTLSVGASGCIMGITATLVGVLILNWMAMSEGQLRESRGMLTCMVIMIVIFTLMFTIMPSTSNSTTSRTDNYAHLGGFLGGLFLSMAIGKIFGRADGPYEKKVRYIGYGLSAALILSTLIPLVSSK